VEHPPFLFKLPPPPCSGLASGNSSVSFPPKPSSLVTFSCFFLFSLLDLLFAYRSVCAGDDNLEDGVRRGVPVPCFTFSFSLFFSLLSCRRLRRPHRLRLCHLPVCEFLTFARALWIFSPGALPSETCPFLSEEQPSFQDRSLRISPPPSSPVAAEQGFPLGNSPRPVSMSTGR